MSDLDVTEYSRRKERTLIVPNLGAFIGADSFTFFFHPNFFLNYAAPQRYLRSGEPGLYLFSSFRRIRVRLLALTVPKDAVPTLADQKTRSSSSRKASGPSLRTITTTLLRVCSLKVVHV